MSQTEKVTELFEQHKAAFVEHGFHTMLWKILVDRVLRDRGECCFTPLRSSSDGDSVQVVIAVRSRGYIPTSARVLLGDEGDAALMELNQAVFKLDPTQVIVIECASLSDKEVAA